MNMNQPIELTNVKPVCGKDCPDRSYKCHGKCEKYKAYRDQCDAEMLGRFQKNQLKREVNDAVLQAVKRLPGKRRY